MNNVLKMECDRCAVANNCEARGASPLIFPGGMAFCHIIGGYGRNPVDKSILSEESKKKSLRDGECLTIAEVPRLEETGRVEKRVVFIFSSPVRHAREKTSIPKGNDIYPSSHK